ncbi:acyl carrier protein [Photobacterium sagamiensis]|uniref:acyl carrier protein n=1 Tax=Photobacterium sagamiensis TaxID=2910241 RepID=UPI003D0E894C
MTIKSSIRTYILENFLFTDDESELDNNDSFLENGIIDSTGVLEIIFFLEEEFGIKIKDEEMIPDNLDSVTNIVNLLQSKIKVNNII